MPSPKKGLLCNLNHVHLQHISLGLHLSRHPELREETNPSTLLRERTGCLDCGDGGDSSELVDANSNHPLLPCRCCDLHPLTPEVKEGLTAQQLLANGWVGKHDNEEEEGPGSPFDPDSSSVSSSSDLSLDDTPVSVYCKPFPSEEVSSPESQPNIVPLDDAQNVHPMPKLDERRLNLNIRTAEQPTSRVWDSPDSLCSISSLQSTPDTVSPDKQILAGPVLVDSRRPPPPPPVRPYRAPPAVPVAPGLDSNCNAVPAREAKPEGFSVGRVDVNSNREPPPRPRFGGVPPPVPPRTKKNLQALRQSKAEKPNQEAVSSTVSDSSREMQVEVTKKNITSFHELAQKRKKATAVPPAPQTRKEQSDWLIVFSPDTEFPPSHEVPWGSAPSQEKASLLALPAEPANPPACAQSGVTTFKELRYRKQKSSQLAPKGAAQLLQPPEGPPRGNLAPQEGNPAVPSSGHFRGPQEGPPRRKAPRPGLQPIVEGSFEDGEERGGAERKMFSQSAEDLPNGKRDLWLPGKQERGDGSLPSGSSCGPHHHPFHPFLVHFSLVDGQETPDPFSSSLENVELTSPDRTVPAFFPRLKTLSCEEICLLAGPQGRATLSPENLLPVRLSPIGAYSPPARSVLPFLESPDLAVLFSPFFPRSKTYPALAFSPRQVPKPPCGAGPGRVTGDKMGDEESGVPKPLRHSQSFGGIPSSRRLRKVDADRTSTQLQEEKKALLVAISASVDKIVAHFSTARNLVQKAQLGDSRLNPDVGYLVLNTLCPALRALVSDGLKPFQKDIITGQRPSSPWSVVEASVKPGPQTRSLNALYWRVSRLAPLRSNQQRFHAFILGLLNTKQLEQWFAHLQHNSELISALYVPTAFLVLSQCFCHRWAEELLLLLEPLSTLTFQLDLLFEHHHLTLEIRPTAQQATTPSPREPAAGSYKPTKQALPRCLGSLSGPSSPIREPTLPRRQENGDRSTRTLLGDAGSPEPNPQQEMEEKQRSWWEQLSRASGVYASTVPSVSRSQSFPCAHWTKLRMAVSEAIKEAKVGMLEAAGGGESGPASASGMGNLPAGEASRKAETDACPVDAQVAEETPDAAGTPGDGKGKRLGWLFGANVPATPTEPDSNLAKPSKRPSSWLPPAMNVLALVMRTGPAEANSQEGSWEEDGSGDALQFRAVRALCDHAGNGAGHLSFRKGDVLQILDTVNEDWLQCSHGDHQGLVPVGYTSLLV